MIGLQLTTEKKVISASLKNGGIQILVNKVTGENEKNTGFYFTGYNRCDGNLITFYKKKELKLGDEFTIKVIDVLKNSPSLEVRPIMSKEKLIDQKLRSYKALKIELEKLNLI